MKAVKLSFTVRADACPTCHTAMKVHTISFSCWSCLFAKVLKHRRRVAQIRASKKGAAPKYKKGAAPTLPVSGSTDISTVYEDDLVLERKAIEFAGRNHDIPSMERVITLKVECGQVLFADLHIFRQSECFNGMRYMFVLVDLKSFYIWCKALKRKTACGAAFRSIVLTSGISTRTTQHKILISDGCGSNKHLERMAEQLNYGHSYSIKGQPNTNLAELGIGIIGGAAQASMCYAGMHSRYLPFAWMYAARHHAFIPSSSARGNALPYAILTGVVPTPDVIDQLVVFGSPGSALMTKQDRDKPAKYDPHRDIRKGEPVVFWGYHGDRDLQPFYMTTTGRIKRGRDVVFVDAEQVGRPQTHHYLRGLFPHVFNLNIAATLEHMDDVPDHVLDLTPSIERLSERINKADLSQIKVQQDLSTREAQLDDTDSDDDPDQLQAVSDMFDVPESDIDSDQEPSDSVSDLSSIRDDTDFNMNNAQAGAGDDHHSQDHHDSRLDKDLLSDDPDDANEDSVEEAIDKSTHVDNEHDNIPRYSTRSGRPNLRGQALPFWLVDDVTNCDPDRICNYFDNLHKEQSFDLQDFQQLSQFLGLEIIKDAKWKRYSGPEHRDKVIAALNKELHSLIEHTGTLIPITAKSSIPLFNEAVSNAIPGRVLLDVKRDGTYKVRCVKRGDLDPEVGVECFSHTARLDSLRTAFAGVGLKGKAITSIDVMTAFLQTDKPPPDAPPKYLRLRNPLYDPEKHDSHNWRTHEFWIFKQHGSLYGESSASRAFEDSISKHLTKPEAEDGCGFIRGTNDPCVFYHPKRDIVLVLFVDDNLLIATPTHTTWFISTLKLRFDCKPEEVLTVDNPMDFLGITIARREYTDGCEYITFDMEAYCDRILDLTDTWWGIKSGKDVDTPISPRYLNLKDKHMNESLDNYQRKLFLSATGCIGWLVNCVRFDLSHSYSMLAQYMAQPTVGALKGVQHVLKYIRSTKQRCIRVRSDTDYLHGRAQPVMQVYSDAGATNNPNPANKRKAQMGCLIMMNGMPIVGKSYVSGVQLGLPEQSMAMADPIIGRPHVSQSTGEAETYAAGNAATRMMAIKHVCTDLHINVKTPINLWTDATTAIAFAKNTVSGSRMGHVYDKQAWVELLRNAHIIAVCKIDTKVNPADIFTKYFPDGRAFKQLISQFMHDDMGSTIATAASTQTFTADALQSTMAEGHAINSKRFIT